MEKLQPGASDFISGKDSLLIDLSSWYKESLAPKIETIQSAIDEKRLISFCYYAPRGESSRVVEPYYLVFRWSSWYVWGWCTGREDFRLFKLNRMDELVALEEPFAGREVPLPDLSNEKFRFLCRKLSGYCRSSHIFRRSSHSRQESEVI